MPRTHRAYLLTRRPVNLLITLFNIHLRLHVLEIWLNDNASPQESIIQDVLSLYRNILPSNVRPIGIFKISCRTDIV